MRYIEACQCNSWHLKVWPKLEPGKAMRVPFRCRSWRHEGDCRLWKGAQDFVRIKEAMTKEIVLEDGELVSPKWSHIVCTFRHGAGDPSKETFRNCVVCWAKLRKRIIRSFGPIRYIQTWEVHRSLWPHVHIALWNEEIFRAANDTPKKNWIRLLQRMASECGFGYVGWLEPLRDQTAMAGYFVKVARELTGTGKEYQIPLNSPPHFRRLRASVRLLPPVHKNEDFTGVLIAASLGGDDAEKSIEMMSPKTEGPGHDALGRGRHDRFRRST